MKTFRIFFYQTAVTFYVYHFDLLETKMFITCGNKPQDRHVTKYQRLTIEKRGLAALWLKQVSSAAMWSYCI